MTRHIQCDKVFQVALLNRVFVFVASILQWLDGGVVVAFLSKLKRGFGSTFSFFADSWSELKKVKWPNRREIVSYTIVVIVTVVFVTIYFEILDLGISEIIRLIFG